MDMTAFVAAWGFTAAVGVLVTIAVLVGWWQQRRHAADAEIPGVPILALAIGMTVAGVAAAALMFGLTGLTARPHTLAEDLVSSLAFGAVIAIILGAWSTVVASVLIASGGRGRGVGIVSCVLGGLLAVGYGNVVGAVTSGANAAVRASADAVEEAALVERSSALHLEIRVDDVVYAPPVDGDRVISAATLVLQLGSDRPIELDPTARSSMNVFPVDPSTYAQRSDLIPLPGRLETGAPVALRLPLAFDGTDHPGVAEPIVISGEAQDFRGQHWHAILFLQDTDHQSYRVDADFTIPP
jgi:hypothetical protein